MNREIYLRTLAAELRRLPKEEYDKAMGYYVEYFDEAGPENEAEVIADLGEPKAVAMEIIADTAMKRMDDPEKIVRKPFSSIWTVILAICAAPMALPVAVMIIAAAGMLILGLLLAVFGVLIAEAAVCASGVISVVIGFILLFSQPATGIINLGLGLFTIGLGILLGFFVIWMLKGIAKGIRGLFRKVIRKGSKS